MSPGLDVLASHTQLLRTSRECLWDHRQGCSVRIPDLLRNREPRSWVFLAWGLQETALRSSRGPAGWRVDLVRG